MSTRFEAAWRAEEEKALPPTRARRILHQDFWEFARAVLANRNVFAQRTVHNLYAGDIYILKDAFPRRFIQSLQRKTMDYFRSKPSGFHKMLEGTPDFHRAIDLESGKKYSFRVCKHSAFFYWWNGDPLHIFPNIYRRWRPMKVLMGLKDDEYERNTPKDGVVDRIQIAHYPSKIGYLEPHCDPHQHQRLFFSGYLSTRGVDYQGGGFYVVGRNNEVIELEKTINAGDVGLGYATVYHGVAPCNRHLEPKWNSSEGRWFLSMYSNASDEVKHRHTGHPVKLNLPNVLP